LSTAQSEALVDQAAAAAAAARGPNVVAQLMRHPGVLFGGAVLLAMGLIALLAPVLGTLDPAAIDPADRNLVPGSASTIDRADGQEASWVHWMGTDSLGRDVYSRVLYGARVSLIIGVAVAVLSIAVGLVIGLVSGYIRWLDAVVMRVMDGLMAFPAIILAIALMASLGPSVLNVVVAIGVVYAPRVARIVRGSVLVIRETAYVEAARALGASDAVVIARHVLPNCLSPVIVQASFVFAAAVLTEAALSFLGVGVPPYVPSWGNILADGRLYLQQAPWLVLYPGAAIMLTIFGLNLLGDGLRDLLDPRLRGVTAERTN
jgi:peptide/nickel transport system permease protein